MAEPNYEALGRYYAALEIFQGLSLHRHDAIQHLSVLLSKSVSNPAEMVVLTLDVQKVEELSREVIRLNNALMQTVEIINHHAEECDKPKVKIIAPPF